MRINWVAKELRSSGIKRRQWTRYNLVRFLETKIAMNPHFANRAKEVMEVAKEIENGASIAEALDWCRCKDDFVRRKIFFFQLGAWTNNKLYQGWGL